MQNMLDQTFKTAGERACENKQRGSPDSSLIWLEIDRRNGSSGFGFP